LPRSRKRPVPKKIEKKGKKREDKSPKEGTQIVALSEIVPPPRGKKKKRKKAATQYLYPKTKG